MPLAQKSIAAARAALAIPHAGVGLEALDVHPRGIPGRAPVLAERLQQPGGTAHERLALAPVGAQPVELRRRQAALLHR